MRFIGLGLTSIVTILALASTALAQPESEEQVQARLAEDDFARGGYYFAMEGLAAVENTEIVRGDEFVVSGGFEMRVGSRHNRWLASDLLGLYVSKFGSDWNFVPPFGVLDGSYLSWGMYASERFYPSRSRFQPFLAAGLGFLRIIGSSKYSYLSNPGGIVVIPTPGNTTGFSMIFSTGMEIYAQEGIAVTLQANYHMQFGNIDGTDFITGGLGMQFF